MNPVNIANLAKMAILTELIAVGNFLDAVKVHLFKSPVSLGPNTLLGDFAECDFTGYAPSSAVVWGVPFLSPQNVPTVDGGLKSFQVGAMPTIFNTVYGYYLTDSAGTELKTARTFDTPVILSLPLQGFGVVPSVPVYLAS